MNNQQDAFREEAYELLTELETALLELEETPEDEDLVNRVFRAMHTIKGSGAMFGFDDIADFTHEVETVFDYVREGKMRVTTNLVNLTLSARDRIKTMLDASVSGQTVDGAASQEIVEALQNLVPKALQPGHQAPDHEMGAAEEMRAAGEMNDPGSDDGPMTMKYFLPDAPDDTADQTPPREQTYRIGFKPRPNLFKTGSNPLLLIDELRAMGTCTVVPHTDAIPLLAQIDPESCYIYWDVILTTPQDINAIRDVFIFVEDDCDIDIRTIDVAGGEDTDGHHKMIGEILVERGDIGFEDLKCILEKQPRIGEMLVDSNAVTPGAVQAALAEQAHIKKVSQQKPKAVTSSSVRVASEKLDMLVDLVGELVTVQARLSQKAAAGADADLLNIAEVVERLTAELRDNTLSIRMLPIGTTFSKFKRLVRDLSADLGNEVTLTTSGGETELDKTVIEQLNDPLVHIIRNSVDHGIESPQTREAAGKPRQGTIHLSAEHSGASVLIRIKDDGAGLDARTIRAKAEERGLLAADADMSDKEIFSLIFAPGFSTAQNVTSVSGRGVGMDVVKRGIESLRGTISVDSTKGEGTAITLKLPLTLAIIDGLLVELKGDKFVLPLSAIEECVELTREDVARTHGRNILNIRGAIVPYVQLRERFQIAGEAPDIEQVIINEINGRRVGIVVDRVIGEHQIVIKTMSALYQDVEEVSGATILGDGSVALILDVAKLLEDERTEVPKAA